MFSAGRKTKSTKLDPYASRFFDDMLHTHLLQLTGTVWLNTVFKKTAEKDIGGESKRSEMVHLVEKVGHASCYIHSKDTVEYLVLAWTVQVRDYVCLHTTQGSPRSQSNTDLLQPTILYRGGQKPHVPRYRCPKCPFVGPAISLHQQLQLPSPENNWYTNYVYGKILKHSTGNCFLKIYFFIFNQASLRLVYDFLQHRDNWIVTIICTNLHTGVNHTIILSVGCFYYHHSWTDWCCKFNSVCKQEQTSHMPCLSDPYGNQTC